MADYVSNRDVSLLRFGLTRTVTSLRDREVTSVHRYQRLFVRHLRDHSPELDALTVEVMAASVVTAHNSVLRDWLQGGATGDPMPSLHVALGQVQQLFAGHAGAAPLGKSVIAVFSADAPVADVVTAIEAHAERRASPAPER